MNVFQEILVYIVETIGMLFLLFVILRFLLQLARADFYNPICQATQKITNPFLLPLRKIIPGLFGIDLASIVLALLVQLVIGELVALIVTQSLFNPANLLIWGALGILNVTIYIGIGCIIIMVISSFVAPYSTHPVLTIVRQLMEPLIAPVQKIIPSVGGLDFSVMFVGMFLFITQKLLYALAAGSGISPALAPLVIGF